MIKNFAIIPKLVKSDHCPIEFSLKVQPFCNTNKSIKAYDYVAEYKAYHKYIWNVSRIDQYKLSLRNDECIKIIDLNRSIMHLLVFSKKSTLTPTTAQRSKCQPMPGFILNVISLEKL